MWADDRTDPYAGLNRGEATALSSRADEISVGPADARHAAILVEPPDWQWRLPALLGARASVYDGLAPAERAALSVRADEISAMSAVARRAAIEEAPPDWQWRLPRLLSARARGTYGGLAPAERAALSSRADEILSAAAAAAVGVGSAVTATLTRVRVE